MSRPSNVELEAPIQLMIDATNRGDSAAVLRAFADDAVLVDWGRTFAGKKEIARWNNDENVGTQNKLRVTKVNRTGHEVSVGVDVKGNGYNGAGTLTFHLEGESIKRLVIS